MRTRDSMRYFDVPDAKADPKTAASVIIPVPYDGTSTWKKGADRAPEAVLEASQHIELFDVAIEAEPWQRGIAALEPITWDGRPEGLADELDPIVFDLIRSDKVPVIIGGDHSVSIGAIRGAARAVPGLSVLQIDAHADTRESYAGSAFNHACVMARAREWCPVVQVGIRAVDASERPGLDPDRTVYAHQVNGSDSEASWIDRAVSHLGDAVYVTVDVDGFDPSVVPATGTPEPGGLDWYQVNELLRRVARARTIVAFDVVELLPTPGQWASDFLVAKLIYRMLGLIGAHHPRT